MDRSYNKNGILEGLKGNKKKLLTVALLVLGCLLMLFSRVKGGSEENGGDSLSEYKHELEGELTDLLSSIEGVGRCEVKISFSEGERIEYRGTSKISETPPRVLGVSVVCDGGGRADVRAAITECLTALFDIGANRVAVVKRN